MPQSGEFIGEPVATKPDKSSFWYYEEIMKSQARSPWDIDRELGTWTWWCTTIILAVSKLRQKFLESILRLCLTEQLYCC